MPRDWGDAEPRPKRRVDDRRDPPRSSPDGLRREADLRSQLTSRPARRSPARDSRDPRRSPPRQSRRSPARDDRRSHSPARRDPPREDSRDRANSPARRSPARGRSPTRRSPARDGRGSRRPSPPRQAPPASGSTAPENRHYQPPRAQAAFPPSNGGNGNRGHPGAKKKKKGPPCPPPAASSAAVVTPASGAVAAPEGPSCFNCVLPGHFQVACPNPPTCYLCKEAGHPAVLCPERPVTEEIMMYGHGIEDMGFFHIEVPELPPPSPSLLALVTVVGKGVATPELIEAELNHLCRCKWDWQVTSTAPNAFSVIFPDALSMGLCTRSDSITLALNGIVVNISEPRWDPKAVAVLDTAWILIAGLPDVARSERVIRSMSKILGKVVVVDELSLRKEEEVRVKVKCLDASKLHTTLRVFFNDDGYDLTICPEPPNHICRPRLFADSLQGMGPRMPMAPTTGAPATPASTTTRRTMTSLSAPAPRLVSPPTPPRVAAAPGRAAPQCLPLTSRWLFSWPHPQWRPLPLSWSRPVTSRVLVCSPCPPRRPVLRPPTPLAAPLHRIRNHRPPGPDPSGPHGW
ncbi:uncharacterized protein LOC125547060 [Triticum urartu]|uniref:uncharacterized protein LOC125547060 n=1 Tax=Triticum urartu TaxID=4572 RepID=UPI00204379B5|nr:uncharacterized protein LOC125547060 [Triticum urartu]